MDHLKKLVPVITLIIATVIQSTVFPMFLSMKYAKTIHVTEKLKNTINFLSCAAIW